MIPDTSLINSAAQFWVAMAFGVALLVMVVITCLAMVEEG